MTSSSVQWYQTDSHITVSVLKRKGSEDGVADIRCLKRRCELYVDGTLHWKCVLAHSVVAESCKCHSNRKRYEIKMEKEAHMKWDQFETSLVQEEEDFASTSSTGSCDSATAIFLQPSSSVQRDNQVSNPSPNVESKFETLNISDTSCNTDTLTPLNSSQTIRKNEVEVGRSDNDTLGNYNNDMDNSSTCKEPCDRSGRGLEPSSEDSRDPLEDATVPGVNETTPDSTPTPNERELLAPQEGGDRLTSDSTLKTNDRDIPETQDEPTSDGLTGLVNLGNTCFMNSVVQCMSHTRELLDFFLSNRYRADINRENPLGCEGQLAYCFAGLVRKLWTTEDDYIYPRNLRHLVRSKFTQFQTLHQQDAQEFLGFFLDRLHEDLNKVKKKPLTEPVESKGRPDMEVAEESWEKHKKRNNSKVEDLFLGQFKSTLVCPTCQETSVVFDPYLSISVPIPSKMLHRTVIFLPCDPEKMPTKYMLRLPEEARLELLKGSVARRTMLSMRYLRVFEAHRGKFQTLMTQNQLPVVSIKATDTIIVCEILSSKMEEVKEIPVLQRIMVPSEPNKCESCGSRTSNVKKCTGCKQVAYCGQTCQASDWKFHQRDCALYRNGSKKRGPETIGCPFVICLPRSQCNYDNVVKMCQLYSRRSVYTKGVRMPGCEDSNKSPSEEDNASKTREKFKPFSLSFVSQHGDTVKLDITPDDCTPHNIKDHFLSVDWNNDSTKPHYMEVVNKEMECEDDASVQQYSHIDESKPVTLKECLELFTEPETLTKEDAWYCPNCKAHREATKQMSIWRLPEVLVLHLKRFSYQNLVIRGKVDKFVKFPLKTLDMLPYILGDAKYKMDPSKSPCYDLYGVVNHHGLSNYGHYTTYIKPTWSEDEVWFYFDDENVKECKRQDVVTKDAYVLFYKRKSS